MVKFLSLESSTGRMFEFSKEPKDGFEEHTYEGTDKVKKTVYRKYYTEGLYGYLRSLHTIEESMGDKKVQMVRIVVEDETGDLWSLKFPMKTGKGGLTDFTVGTFRTIHSLVEGRCYRFFPYVIEDKEKLDKNGKPRRSSGMSIKIARVEPSRAVDDANKIPALTLSYTKKKDGVEEFVKGDVPQVTWKPGIDGNVMDTMERDVFLWNHAKEHWIGQNFKLGGGKAQTFDSTKEGIPEKQRATPQEEAQSEGGKRPASAPKKEAEKPEVSISQAPAGEMIDDDDDLPF